MLGALGQQAALAISSARRYQHERQLLADLELSYDELQRTFSELQHAQEQLLRTARLRALGELAAGVAHDFNNLLSGILGNAQLLLDEPDPERRHMLGVIEQAALDGAAVVRRIQEFARQREDRTREPVDLAAVIDSALSITRAHWQDLALRDGRPNHQPPRDLPPGDDDRQLDRAARAAGQPDHQRGGCACARRRPDAAAR